MPAKTDLGTLLEKAQGRWRQYDDEERKRQAAEQKKLERVDVELSKGRSWEDISKSTGLGIDKVKEYSQQSRPDYGIKKESSNLQKLTSKLQSIGYKLGASPGQEAATRSLDASQEQNLRLLQDPSIPVNRKTGLLKNVAIESAEAPLVAAQNTAEITRQTSPQSMAKGVAEGITSLPADIIERGTRPFRSGVDLGLKGDALIAAQEKAKSLPEDIRAGARGLNPSQQAEILKLVSQGLNEKQLRNFVKQAQEEKRKSDLQMAGTAVEAASLGVGGGELAQAAKQGTKQLLKTTVGTAVAGAGGGVGSELRTNPAATGAELAKTAAFGAGTGVGLAGATAAGGELLKRGNAVTDNARLLPETATISQEISKLDDAIVQAEQSGNRTQARALAGDKTFLQEETNQVLKSVESASLLESPASSPFSATGKTKTSKLASGTESKAISAELTKGFKDLPTFQGMNMDEQAARVVNIMDTDYGLAKRIALGEIPPPEGVAPGSFYKGVEARATRDRDVKLLEQLATESTIPKQASLQGQQIASLAYRDPESPVTAFKTISEARKTSNLDIPRTIAPEEAEKVVSLSQDVATAKNAIAEGGDRLAYGRARVAYDDYVQELIAAANKKNLKDALKHPVDTVVNVAGVSKSLRASLDNSALLRQGWKTMFTHPGTWAKNSLKSFEDFAKAVGNKEVINEVRADIVSRPNSLNGMYKKLGVDVFGIKEEAFPSALPEKIPIAGRFFKGSEAAYTGFVQRTRADLADKYLEIALKSGVDLTSKKELKSIGKLVNSLTSRGDLGRTGERASKVLNNVFFSPRLLKSNIDVLTGHQFQKGVTPFVRKRAARNLLQIALGSAAALKLAQEVTGGKVEYDPRSSNFGKIKIGDTRFDLSGGMSSIVTLGARLATVSSKSSTSGEVTRLNSGEFGAQTSLDTIYNFFENKTSPAVSVARDYLKGETFEGEKPTLANTIKNLTLPLIIGSYQELKDNPRAASLIPSLISEGLGVSVNTYGLESNWNASNSKQVTAFKEKVGKDRFETANKTFNERFQGWYDKVSADQKFWGLPIEQREKLVLSKKNALTEEVMEEQNFKYKTPKTDRSTKGLIRELQKY